MRSKRTKRLSKIDKVPTSVKLFTHTNPPIDRLAQALGKPRSTIIRELVEEALTARRLNQLKRTVRKGPWQLKDALTVEQVEAIPDTAQTFADEILEELRTARAAAVYAAELAEFSAAAMWRLLKQTDDYKDRSLEQYQDIQRKIKKQAREVVRDNLEKRLEQEAERADE